ncbi:MAG: hypothetical protein R3330_07340 [Saprospiraceae bacterium]|nr:hypothetical protein [Saprospiraceae bacterium]
MSQEIATIQARLEELAEQLASCRRIPEHLQSLHKEIKRKRQDYRRAARVLEKEEADVNKLQRASVRSLFYRFLKSQERQLDIELQEYVAAALHYNACVEEIELLEFEIAVLEDKLTQLARLEEDWKAAIEKKAQLIEQHYPEAARRLGVLDHSAYKIMLERREIDEAIIAGTKAKTYLRSIRKYLLKIEGWGSWYDGTGRYAPYAKKSLIDKARKKAIQADVALHQFDKELSDVFKKLRIANKFSVDAFRHFLDLFYNNLITDWIVRRNLQHTTHNVEAAIDSVQRYLDSLKEEKQSCEDQLKEIERKKEDLIYRSK